MTITEPENVVQEQKQTDKELIQELNAIKIRNNE